MPRKIYPIDGGSHTGDKAKDHANLQPNSNPTTFGLPITETGQLNPNELYTDPNDPSHQYYLPIYRIARQNNSYQVALRLNEQAMENAVAELQVRLTSDERQATVSTTRITFDKLPDGSATTLEAYLRGDEYAAQNILLAGAPEGSYCANGKLTAIRRPGTYGGVDFPFLTTASPQQISHCNGVPIAISFIEPVGAVTLTFAGASVVYMLKAFDANGRLLGTAQQRAEFGGPNAQITYRSAGDNISRITFGYQAAITAIKEIQFASAATQTNQTVTPLPHDVTLYMRYMVATAGDEPMGTWQSFTFAQINQLADRELIAIHSIKSFAELNAIYRAISEPNYRCQLVAHCEADLVHVIHARLAIHHPVAPAPIGSTWHGANSPQERAVRTLAEVFQKRSTSRHESADLVDAKTATRSQVVITLPGQATPIPVRGKYDQILPFTFVPALHPDIYPDYAPGGEIKLLRHPVAHDFVIYQDMTQRSIFYYLPQEFRLMRKETPPFAPALVVSFSSREESGPDGAIETNYRVHFSFQAAPYLPPERKREALDYITTNRLGSPGVAASLTPFIPDEAHLALLLPKDEGGIASIERPDAEIVFNQHIIDSFELSAAAFAELFHSMRTGGAAMNGTVTFTLPGNSKPYQIPLNGRLDLMSGVAAELYLAGRDTVNPDLYQVKLQNVIESSLEIQAAAISLLADPERLTWVASKLADTQWPQQFKPQESCLLKVQPTQAIDHAWGVKLLLIQAVVALDFEALWQSVLEIPGWDDITHQVTVTVAAAHFSQPAAPTKVSVLFNHHEAQVDFSPSTLRQVVTLTKPILPYLLREEEADDYFYQVLAWQGETLIGRSPILQNDSRELTIVPPQEVTA